MRLRTRLILAFLLMTVLPLAGLTLYSFKSSFSAFRQAVHTEAQQMASEMGDRMELLRANMNRRIARVGAHPFHSLLDSDPEKLKQNMEGIYSGLVSQLGETAPLIESIEFQPMPESSEPKKAKSAVELLGNSAPVPPELPGGIVIVMPGAIDPEGGVSLPEQPPTQGELGLSIKVPEGRTFLLRQRGQDRRAKEGVRGILREVVVTEAAEQLRAESELLAKFLKSEQLQKEQELSARSRELAQQSRALWVKHSEELKRLRSLDLDIDITADGKTAGHVTAQLDAAEVLQRVLPRPGNGKGDLAFAVDRSGHLLTLDPEVQQKLEKLNLVSEGKLRVPRSLEDWIVVAHEVPDSGMTFGIARPIGEGLQEIRRAAIRNFGVGVGLIGIALFGILPISRRMTRDLKTLTEGARNLAAGDLNARVPVRSGDEFGKLAESFNQMAHDLNLHQKRLLKQEGIEKELEMCRHIQRELLPRGILRMSFAEAQGISIPAREVGGDFFNYFTLPDGNLAVLIGDVSGKGVPAALLMANIQATLKASLPSHPDLAALAEKLDKEIGESTPAESYLTLFMGILDSTTGVFRWVNAGHNPQYLLSADGEFELLASTGRPLGLLPGGAFEQREITIGDGDSLFLYTDGVVEAFDASGEEFGNSRLEQILRDTKGLGLHTTLETVEAAITQHQESAAASDDATMMILRATHPHTLSI